MDSVYVPLSENNVARLMALRERDETLDAVVTRCVDAAHNATSVAPTQIAAASSPSLVEPPVIAAAVSTCPSAAAGCWAATIFEEFVRAATLGELLRNVVDAVHDLDPAAIERLSLMKARTRRYVARAREDVHAGRRDLPVLQTRSGWWVSANIGRPDLIRSLRALCAATDLRFGDDIVFPARAVSVA